MRPWPPWPLFSIISFFLTTAEDPQETHPSLEYTFVDGRGVTNQAKMLANPTLVEAGIRNALSGDGVTIRPKKDLEKSWNDMKD